MSITSISGLMSNYSPLSGRSSSVEDEKESHLRLNPDVEAGEKQVAEKKSRWIDGRTVSDAIIGLSDGMTVPFALTAGLSALGDTKVVVFGGMAELIAGAISMGLGGYLGAKSEEYVPRTKDQHSQTVVATHANRINLLTSHRESYKATLKETQTQTMTDPASVTGTISEIFEPYELPSELVSQLTHHLSASPLLPSFLMNFQHTLPEPSESRAVICALTIALGYFIGGFVPLLPYFFVGPHEAFIALRWSIATMVVALFIFGYGKTCFVCGWRGRRNIRKGVVGGVQMVLVGGLAAGSAMGLVKAFSMLADAGHPHPDHQ